jgi:uncharacterized protein (DUF488 family)
MQQTLLTIGHSTHPMEYFLGLLERHGVTAVCDVRSVPYSRFNPQFNKETLRTSLGGVGVAYVSLGKQLGARSDNPCCYSEGKVQYSRLAGEPLFREGLERLRQGMGRFRVALLCAEKDPLTCHRTILVCREMRAPTLTIAHILADGALETNAAAEKRLVALTGVTADMFSSERECIERAYDQQAGAIAYALSAHRTDSEPTARPSWKRTS